MMEKKERDRWDDAIQSKLQDFEVDPMPDDWDAIADRLPQSAPVIPLRRRLRYWAAAAVISLLIVSGGIYLYDNQLEVPVAQKLPAPETEQPVSPVETRQEPIAPVVSSPKLVAAAQRPVATHRNRPFLAKAVEKSAVSDEQPIAVVHVEAESQAESPKATETQRATKATAPEETSVAVRSESRPVAKTVSTKPATEEKKRSRWSFGMGGGSISAGSDHLLPQYVTNSSVLRSENLSALNAFNTDKFDMAKTDVKHKTPIGIGVSVSYSLSKRFALVSGINYSYLRSEWSTNNTYHVDNEQRLHFIGIPLSLAYKIAEWNKFQFYTSAGAMTEVNVAGKRHMKLYSDNVKILSNSEHVRMKEWLWSVNARAGVSYPIIRFVSAFAEVGVGYYFDNGSEIETIHSEKPFNVSLQFGFRFGF